MASITATPDPASGSVLIQLDRVLANDLFTRVVANSWGTPTVGAAYTQTGGAAANYSVNGTQGVHATATTNVVRMTTTAPGTVDGEFSLGYIIPVNPVGASIGAGLVLRGSGTNYYVVENNLNPSGALEITILKSVAGVFTAISDTAVLAGFTASATQNLTIWAEIQGPRIKASVTLTGDVRPPTYMVEAFDTDYTSGAVGAWTIRNTGNANGSVSVTFDDLAVLSGIEPLEMSRVMPDGQTEPVRGFSFYTETSWTSPFVPDGVAVFWDNEAPFDTDIYYEMTSQGSNTVNLTSNTVSLDSLGQAWLRDPYVPANNIAFEYDGEIFDFCDDEPRIMYAGMGNKVYESASGIFDIIDAARPETVAQTRKRYGSTLFLISKEYADVAAIETITAGGYPILLSLPPEYGFAHPYGTDWITILDIDSSQIGVDGRLPARAWSLPFRLSTPAADTSGGMTGGTDIGGGDATFDALAASVIGATFNSLTASGFTFDQIAAGTGY